MKLRDKYKIMGVEYTILRPERVIFEGQDVTAKIKNWKKEIHILAELDEDVAFKSFLHELIHAFDSGDVLSEETTAHLAFCLYLFLTENGLLKEEEMSINKLREEIYK